MDELFGADVALVRAVYSHRLAILPHPFGSGVYVGGSLEATRASTGVDLRERRRARRRACSSASTPSSARRTSPSARR